MKEIWKPVLDYIGLYEVSNLGRVRSLKYGKIRILKPVKTKDCYLRVGLRKDGKQKWFLVHRLVWEAFNGEIPEGMEVNHINEIKTDNRYPENLNLLTHGDNVNFGTRNKRVSVAMTNGKQSDPVLQLTLDEKLIKEWPSMTEAARNGFSESKISDCCNGKRKTHKGFLWMKKSPLC